MPRLALAGSLAAVLSFLGAPAHAYELQLAPSGEPVRWQIDPISTRIEFEDSPVAPGLASEAARRALETWNLAGSPHLVLDLAPRLGFRFATDPDDPGIDPEALALTHLSFDSLTGEISDAEIVVNGFAFRWAVGDDCRNGADDYEYDLESTLAHEIGHALGLRHSLDQEATMYTRPQPCARDRRDLSADDVEAIADLYAPGAADLPGSFSCSAAGGGGAPLAFIAVAAVFAVRRRRARS